MLKVIVYKFINKEFVDKKNFLAYLCGWLHTQSVYIVKNELRLKHFLLKVYVVDSELNVFEEPFQSMCGW